MMEAAQINDPQKQAEREALLQEEYGKLMFLEIIARLKVCYMKNYTKIIL